MPARAHPAPRRRLGFVAAVVALTLAGWPRPPAAARPAAEAAAPTVAPFAAGEQLVYERSWLGIVAGRAEMVVQAPLAVEELPAYRLASTARSNPFFTRIFPVDDRIESLVEAGPFRSLRFTNRQRRHQVARRGDPLRSAPQPRHHRAAP